MRKKIAVIAVAAALALAVPSVALAGQSAGSGAITTAGSEATTLPQGDLGVTFGFTSGTVGGGPYTPPAGGNIYDLPEFLPTSAETFWENYTEELSSAGVDFVAPVLRSHLPASAESQSVNDGGDPTQLSGLVTAMQQAGRHVQDRRVRGYASGAVARHERGQVPVVQL